MVWAPVTGAKLLVAAGKLVKTHEAWMVEARENKSDADSSADSLSDYAVLPWIGSVVSVRSNIRM